MDLFDFGSSTNLNKPLSERLRPRTLDQMIGLEDLLKENGPVAVLLSEKKLPSLILWGPPGTGKTSFANIVARNYASPFHIVNAVETGAKELREICQAAQIRFKDLSEKSILFVDEVHRLNKSQQDVLLAFIESGALLFIGATTENPGFEVNSALMSRCRLIQFPRLSSSSLEALIVNTLNAECESWSSVLEKESCEMLSKIANGDARKCLNLLEQIIHLYKASSAGKKVDISWPIGIKSMPGIVPSLDLYFNRSDAHFDLASAFIKSIRSSDVDASIYYLARMIKSGEDPKFIARRLVISASEDIGNADPRALNVAVAAAEAVNFVGLPEAGINLAQATTYLACSPKSNRSYAAYKKALHEVELSGDLPIPLHLRNPVNKNLKNWGYGESYKYDHEEGDGVSGQSCLPDAIKDQHFYTPTDRGHESYIAKYMSYVSSKREKN